MTTFFESTHVVEQLSFSMFLSILTFDFNLFFGSFLTFWGPNKLFLWLRLKSGLDEVESKFILYVSFNSDICFYLILGSFRLFGP